VSDESDPTLFELELEAPPNSHVGDGEVTSLLSGESMAQIATKVTALEAFLSLATRNLSFNDFMREILLTFVKVVKSEAGSILEQDFRRECFFFRTTLGTRSDQLDRFTVPLGKGIVGHVAESRQPLSVSNLEESQFHLKSISESVGFKVRNLIALPFIIRGKVYGVLELLNRVGEEAYSPADEELLRYLAEAAAKSIEIRLMMAWALGNKARQPGKNSSEKDSRDAA
jgi:signal transduction protein with GAF and PtsI domain